MGWRRDERQRQQGFRMTQQSDGVSIQHRVSDEVIGRLIDHKLLHDGNRSDPAAVSQALDAFLQELVTARPTGQRPLYGGAFLTPANSTTATGLVLLSLLEVLVALDVLPSQALAAVLLHARSAADAEHQPAGVQEQISHFARILEWGLKRHGAALDADKIAKSGLR
jgi:hypothetical protein